MDLQAAQALVRFGLGRRGTQPAPTDPQGWLARQLQGPDPAVAGPGAADGLRALGEAQALRRARAAAAGPAAPGDVAASGLPGAAGAASAAGPRLGPAGPPGAVAADQAASPGALPGPAGPDPAHPVRALYRADAQGLFATALATDTPFRERLVWFWANHFTVSLRQGQCAALAGAFVREAIRPHVTGRFGDMLLAAIRHPAMLIYLDNVGSVGPGSRAGLRSGRGLNENLARECLELHTLSPAAGYGQADVTEFARVLTGWSVERREEPLGFRYRDAQHEPGERTLLGRSFPPGEQGGIAALAFLAAHPATHRHLATKLVTHFVADDPAPADIRAVEGVLRDTGGDLAAAALALTRLRAAWTPGTKLRAPQDYVVACLRALDLPEARRPDPVRAAASLGQPLWTAPFPIGWPDRAADWAGPEAMLRRVDWAYALAGRAGGPASAVPVPPGVPGGFAPLRTDAGVFPPGAAAVLAASGPGLDAADLREPVQVAQDSLGPLLSAATLAALRGAGSRRDAVTLLLASPEFQRR